MISTRTAKALCTKAELDLVRQSSARHITGLTEKQLKSKISRSRKLRDKYRDLANRQEREARGKQKSKSTRAAEGSGQTRKKQQLFAETLERFQVRLKKLTAANRTTKKKTTKKKTVKKKSVKKKSTKAVTGKKQGKSTTPKKSASKKSASSKKATKRATARAPKKTTKKKTTASAKRTKLSTRAKKAATAAKKSRVARSGRVRKTAHLSSTARRKQGKRNRTRSR